MSRVDKALEEISEILEQVPQVIETKHPYNKALSLEKSREIVLGMISDPETKLMLKALDFSTDTMSSKKQLKVTYKITPATELAILEQGLPLPPLSKSTEAFLRCALVEQGRFDLLDRLDGREPTIDTLQRVVPDAPKPGEKLF